MRRIARTLAVLAALVVVAAGTSGVWQPLLAQSALPTFAEMHAFAADAHRRIDALIRQGYARSPEMMLGFAIAILLPLLALTAAFTRASVRWHGRRQRMLRHQKVASLASGSDHAAMPAGHAWLELDGSGREAVGLNRELIRIGRDRENELTLEHASVAQLHALIRRTTDWNYLIVDVSGGGEGVTINGEPKVTSALRDGDRIGLGALAVTFRRSGGAQMERVSGAAPDQRLH